MLPDAEIRKASALLEPWSFGQGDLELLAAGWRIRGRTNFQWWDCLIVAVAIDAGCKYLLSEDMTHHRTVDGVTILNPFKVAPADVLASH